MIKFFYGSVILTLLSVTTANAAVTTGDAIQIKTIHPSSNSRAEGSVYNGVMRVYFQNPIVWNGVTCRNNAVDIYPNDKLLLTTLFTAFATRKKIKIEVNDSQPKIGDVCKATALFVDM